MYARINTFEGDVKRFARTHDEVQEFVIPGLRDVEGFAGYIGMVDHETGRSVNITLWDSQEALEASEDAAAMVRLRATLPNDVRLTRVERYEVADIFLTDMES